MKFFSILLPSKGGENYISNVIKSILDQDFEDYEIIIGDNNNSLNFQSIINSFKSEKIKVVRSNKTLQVSESWSKCLNSSTGKYIITLGDDDCLLKNSLKKIQKLLIKFDFPECLSVNGVGFFEAGSTKEIRYSSFKEVFWKYKKDYLKKVFLSTSEKEKIIKEFFNFTNLLPLNMQPHIFSKKIANSVEGGLFKPPSPDSYALYSMLKLNKKWAISDEKIFAIGLSKKSFGFYWHNNKIDEGIKFLGSKLDGDFLPGSKLNDYLYTVLKNLKKNQSNFHNYEINRTPYIARQFFVSLENTILSKDSIYILSFLKKLKFNEYIKLLKGLLIFKYYYYALFRLINSFKGKKIINHNMISLNKDVNIYEFTRDFL